MIPSAHRFKHLAPPARVYVIASMIITGLKFPPYLPTYTEVELLIAVELRIGPFRLGHMQAESHQGIL